MFIMMVQLATLTHTYRILNLSEVSSLSPECLIYLFYRDGQISILTAKRLIQRFR